MTISSSHASRARVESKPRRCAMRRRERMAGVNMTAVSSAMIYYEVCIIKIM
jgi:hypothetical protein